MLCMAVKNDRLVRENPLDSGSGGGLPVPPPRLDLEFRNRRDLPVDQRVEQYLEAVTYPLGSDLYFGQMALREALHAFREGNYGIGAVLISRQGDSIVEVRGRNGMGSPGHDVYRAHAEARALETFNNPASLTGLEPGSPSLVSSYDISQNPALAGLPQGTQVYGTLEPCPMCMCMLINQGVLRSVSNCQDELGAIAFGDRAKALPPVWQFLAKARGISFEQTPAEEADLRELSSQIFLETREEIDARLGRYDATARAHSACLEFLTTLEPYLK